MTVSRLQLLAAAAAEMLTLGYLLVVGTESDFTSTSI